MWNWHTKAACQTKWETLHWATINNNCFIRFCIEIAAQQHTACTQFKTIDKANIHTCLYGTTILIWRDIYNRCQIHFHRIWCNNACIFSITLCSTLKIHTLDNILLIYHKNSPWYRWLNDCCIKCHLFYIISLIKLKCAHQCKRNWLHFHIYNLDSNVTLYFKCSVIHVIAIHYKI